MDDFYIVRPPALDGPDDPCAGLPATETCDKLAFELGWDFGKHGLKLPMMEHAGLLQGYEQAGKGNGRRALRHDRYIRKWLQLRYNAWLRQREYDLEVTPEFIKSIDRASCPITGMELTHSTGTPSDWSVDRLNNSAGYARGNLAVMSTKANYAKGALRLEQVIARAYGSIRDPDLTQCEWARLAALMHGPASVNCVQPILLPFVVEPAPFTPCTYESALQWTLVSQLGGGPQACLGRLKAALSLSRQKEFHKLIQKLKRRHSATGAGALLWKDPHVFGILEGFLVMQGTEERARVEGVVMAQLEHAWDPKWLSGWALPRNGRVLGYTPPVEPGRMTLAELCALGVLTSRPVPVETQPAGVEQMSPDDYFAD